MSAIISILGGLLAPLVAPFMDWLYAKIQAEVKAGIAEHEANMHQQQVSAAVTAQSQAAVTDKERDAAAASVASNL